MRKFGRILSLILVVAMLVQLLPASVFAQEAEQISEEVRLSGETEDTTGSSQKLIPKM